MYNLRHDEYGYNFRSIKHFFFDETVVSSLSSIKNCGFGAVEIWYEHIQKTGESPVAIRSRAAELGLRLTCHAPSHDINPISVNRGIRKESLNQILEAIDFAFQTGISTVVVHPGFYSTRKTDKRVYVELFEELLYSLDEAGSRTDICVCLEVMEKKGKNFFYDPGSIRKALSLPLKKVRLTLDCAHVNSHADIDTFLSAIPREWVGHVHLSDYSPVYTHLPLGQGISDIPHTLASLKTFYKGIIIIEGIMQHHNRKESLAASYNYLADSGWITGDGEASPAREQL